MLSETLAPFRFNGLSSPEPCLSQTVHSSPAHVPRNDADSVADWVSMSASVQGPISVYTPMTAISGQTDGPTWAAVPADVPGTRAELEALTDRTLGTVTC